MIDQQSPPSRVSLVEAVLARWLVELSGRRYFVTGLPWHETHRSSRVDGAEAERPVLGESSSESAACVDNEVVPERYVSFGRLLEAGAGHLAAARAAQVAQRRQAAVQARALAAFATARPAVLLDRPDEEVGAAAVAGLLAESVTLVQRLPATWAALAAGSIGWNHARALAEIVGPVKDEARAGVEERLLARADGKILDQLRRWPPPPPDSGSDPAPF